jgi:hypothetical protein
MLHILFSPEHFALVQYGAFSHAGERGISGSSNLWSGAQEGVTPNLQKKPDPSTPQGRKRDLLLEKRDPAGDEAARK